MRPAIRLATLSVPSLALVEALGEAGRARRRRSLIGSASAAPGSLAVGLDGDRADHLMFEALISKRGGARATLNLRLSRLATLVQMRSRSIAQMRTSLPRIRVEGVAADAICAIVVETLFVADSCARQSLQVYVAVEWNGDELVLAIAHRASDAFPVPTAEGARALRRADLIASLMGGGLQRGVGDGRMLYGVAIAMREVSYG